MRLPQWLAVSLFTALLLASPHASRAQDQGGTAALIDCNAQGLTPDMQKVCDAVAQCYVQPGKTLDQCWAEVRSTQLVAGVLQAEHEEPGFLSETHEFEIKDFPLGKFKIGDSSEWNSVNYQLTEVKDRILRLCATKNVTCKIMVEGWADAMRIRRENQVTNEVAAESGLGRSRAEQVVHYLQEAGVLAQFSPMGQWDIVNQDEPGTYRRVVIRVTVETYHAPQAKQPLVFVNNRVEAAPAQAVSAQNFNLGIASRLHGIMDKADGSKREFLDYGVSFEPHWVLHDGWLGLGIPGFVGFVGVSGEDKVQWSLRADPWIYIRDHTSWSSIRFGAGFDTGIIFNLTEAKHTYYGGGVWLSLRFGSVWEFMLGGAAGGDYEKWHNKVWFSPYISGELRLLLHF